jgi:hypothetical protein
LLRIKEQTKKNNILDIFLLVAIALIPIFIIYSIIHFSGPLWDITVRYLQGRTLVNAIVNHVSLKTALNGDFTNNLLYYFEPYREPLSIPIFAFLDLFFKNPIFPYIVIIYILFLFTLYKLSKELNLDKLIVFSVFVNSYIIYFLFVPNGGEALSIISVFIALLFLLRKKPISGLFFGIAALAKYPSIFLFPLVLFLGDRKKILEAIILELLTVLIWGGIDYFLYGIPFYSYFASIAASGVTGGPISISAIVLLKVLIYPVIFAILGIVILLLVKKRKKLNFKLDYTSKIMITFVILSAVCYVAIIGHTDPISQGRYGYLLAVSLLLSAAMILNYVIKQKQILKYVIAICVIILLLYVLYATYVKYNTIAVAYYNPDNPNSIYVHAGNTLGMLGFAQCRFISNTWVPMIYSGYYAYPPTQYIYAKANPQSVRFTNNTILNYISNTANNIIQEWNPNYSAIYKSYLQEQERYPILIFNYDGVPASLVINLNSSKLVYADQNISIYLPQNVTCYKG